MHVIENSFHLISTSLMNIINLSLLKGIFPDKLKIAKVIPIYKAEDPCLFVNYRPISSLPNFSKCFEKVMYNRLNLLKNTKHCIAVSLGLGKIILRHLLINILLTKFILQLGSTRDHCRCVLRPLQSF